jgi:hypothetical protein
LAELQLALGTTQGDATWLTAAIATLDRAWRLDGCGNRVAFLQARARLERARLAMASGDEPQGARADLEAVLALGDAKHAHVPDNEPWRDLLAEAQRALDVVG